MTERTIKIPRPNDPISAAMPTLDVLRRMPLRCHRDHDQATSSREAAGLDAGQRSAPMEGRPLCAWPEALTVIDD
jgi:hypothetical protein